MADALIRTATAADAERCLAVLALAFGSDPPSRWAWPDPQQYWRHSRALLKHSVAAPLSMELPTIMRAFPGSPCGCRRVQRRMRHPWCGSSRRR